MPKGPVVTHEVEYLIAKVYKEHPKWKAPAIRNEVRDILRRTRRATSLPERWPSLSKVQKVLADVRRNDIPSAEDEPWSIASLTNHPIPPDALPVVLEAAEHCQRAENKPLTIREAKWVARLHILLNTIAAQYGLARATPELCCFWAAAFATHERIGELTGKPALSRDLDYVLYTLSRGEITREAALTELSRYVGEDGKVHLQVSRRDLRRAQEAWRKLGYPEPFNDPQVGIVFEEVPDE